MIILSAILKTAVLRFWAPFGNLGATYDDHLELIGKSVVEFLLVLIKLFFSRCYGWGATSDYLLEIKSAISRQRGPVDPNFR